MQLKFRVYRNFTVCPLYQPLVVPTWPRLADICMPAMPAEPAVEPDEANAVPDRTASPAASTPARASPARRVPAILVPAIQLPPGVRDAPSGVPDDPVFAVGGRAVLALAGKVSGRDAALGHGVRRRGRDGPARLDADRERPGAAIGLGQRADPQQRPAAAADVERAHGHRGVAGRDLPQHVQ